MASFQKYFLAIVPEGELQDRLTAIKLELKEEFNIKYALKSPAHITLKMPFTYNEAKEDFLIEKLQSFAMNFLPFDLGIGGVDTFGDRVIFIKVEESLELINLQKKLREFSKKELKLVEELSDRNFHPHMTMAFKDLKKTPRQNIIEVVERKPISEKIVISQFFLLKRAEGRWNIHQTIDLKGISP